MSGASVGLTTILAGLSHALDLTEGHPRGHAERACRIAQALARVIGLDDQARTDLVHATLLKDAGCSSNALRVYELFGGPEHGVKRAVWERDWRKFGEQLRYALQWTERGGSPVRRFRKLASLATAGPHGARELFQIRCARGAEIARRIGCAQHIAQAIHDMDEHWDGGGHPRGLRGEEIPLLARIMGLAQVMEIFWGLGGPAAAIGVAQTRANTWFAPDLVRAAESLATDSSLWEDLFAPDLSRRILAQMPDGLSVPIDDDRLDQVAAAFALIIDGKSPYTFDHSTRVADYAVSIGRQLALDDEQLRRLRRAGLVHDLGKLTVPNSILEHPGKLDEAQWAVVRQHPSFTFDVLARVPVLEELALDAASHHERMDGRGYHRGLPGTQLSITARILGVADVMDALAADRPYRGGMSPDKVLGILTADVGDAFLSELRRRLLHRPHRHRLRCGVELRSCARPPGIRSPRPAWSRPCRPPSRRRRRRPRTTARATPRSMTSRAATSRALEPAWTFHSGDFSGGQGPTPKGAVPGVQTRPVVSRGSLYVTTPSSIVIAIDGETGKEQWRHDPQARATKRCYDAHRGASIWPALDHDRATTRTIFSGTCDGRLIALDAATGLPRRAFGTNGAIDLRPGVDARDGEAYSVTSPPAVFGDLVITGAMVPEGVPRGPAGDVRAFDVRTGKEVWRFHTVPRPGEYGHETWPRDGWQRRTGANVWSSMTVDHERGLVFLPIGSASYDFYGGDRKGRNLFANSLVALDAATGTRRWHQQLVHHDVWDYDPPSQPILADIPRNGHTVPVVIQLTKMGLVFVFERTTGLPIFGIDERTVPVTDVPGEETSPTQPFPTLPAPLGAHPAGDPRSADPRDAPLARRVRGAVRARHERRSLHAAGPDADAAVPRHHGWRDVVGRRRRSGLVDAGRQHQRGRRDRPDGACAGGRVRCRTCAVERWAPTAGSGTASSCRVRRRRGASSMRSISAPARSRGRCRSATSRRSRRRASPAPARRTSVARSSPRAGWSSSAARSTAGCVRSI